MMRASLVLLPVREREYTGSKLWLILGSSAQVKAWLKLSLQESSLQFILGVFCEDVVCVNCDAVFGEALVVAGALLSFSGLTVLVTVTVFGSPLLIHPLINAARKITTRLRTRAFLRM